MRPSKNLENKTLWDTYCRVHLICMNVQAHSSLESPLEYTGLWRIRFVMTFLTILGVMELLCSFRLVLEGKTGKEIPESSRLKIVWFPKIVWSPI